MTILPKIRTRFGEGIGVEIFVSHPDLNENEQSFLTTDYDAGVTSLVLDNANEFGTNEYIVIGSPGSDKAEIVKISAVDGATQTLTVSTTVHAHNRGERVTFIPFNQMKIEASTNGGSSYSALITIDIRMDSSETFYAHLTGSSTDYYRVKFYNETSTNESEVSDGIIATGFADNSAGQIIRSALLSLGEKIDGEVLTKEFLFQALHEGREELDAHPDVERWAFRTVFDYDFGDIIPGRYTLALPSDLREPDTYKNILSLRLGRENYPVIPSDKNYINGFYQNVAHTTLNGAITTANTSIVLTSSGDFNESGAVSIAAEDITEEIDVVDYTNASTGAVTTLAFVEGGGAADTITDSDSGFLTARFFAGQTITVSGSASNDGTYEIDTVIAGTITLISTDDLTTESAGETITIVSNEANVLSSNTLTGATNIDANHADDRDVWQGASFGIPTNYTVDNGTIIFSQPFDNANTGENIKGDYYAKLARVDSDGDLLDEDFASALYIPYLRWRIRKRKDATLKREGDPDYGEFKEKLNAQATKQFVGNDIRLSYQFGI